MAYHEYDRRRVSALDDLRPAARAPPSWLHTPVPNASGPLVRHEAPSNYTYQRPRAHSAAPPAAFRGWSDHEVDREEIRIHRDHRDEHAPRRRPVERERDRGRAGELETDEIRITRRSSESRGWSSDSDFTDDWDYADSDDETDISIRRQHSVSRPGVMAPPPPPVVHEPRVEREVITHYTNVDHGTIDARSRSPTPAPIPARARSRSRHRLSVNIADPRSETETDDSYLRISRSHSHSHPRPTSAAPVRHHRHLVGFDDEARQVAGAIDARGRMGEAYGGVTRDWEVVDVPSGTERVRLDGVGGGAAEVIWKRYDGARRTRFVADGQGMPVQMVLRERERERGRDSREDVSVEINSSRRMNPPEQVTEITRDLVSRSALRARGYPFKETEYFYYIHEYLGPNEVAELVALSKQIRREKRRMRRIDGFTGRGRRERGRDFVDEKRVSVSRHKHRHRDEAGRRVYV